MFPKAHALPAFHALTGRDNISFFSPDSTHNQARYVWGQSLVVEQVLPSPGSWRWVESECGWEPFWTPLPRAAKALEELVM